jgi:nitroreductase
MPALTGHELVTHLKWRYATKEFDSARRIPDETWSAIEESLVLTPSSFGLQPWRFIVVTDQATKDQLAAASWGQRQPSQCSHHVVFAVNRNLTEQDVELHIQRVAEVRSVPVESLAGYRKVMLGALVHGMSEAARLEWASRQAYIALGNFMTCSALLGIDTCPMEGIQPKKYDEILGLTSTPFTCCVACATGYRAASDRYATMAKVRFHPDQLIIRH